MKHFVTGGIVAAAMTVFAFGASAETIVLGAAVSQSVDTRPMASTQ